MIKPPQAQKHYGSAKQRFLKGILLNFFRREFTKLFGPLMREKIVDELIKLIVAAMPEKAHVKPGQIVWNAIDIHTRSDSPKRRFVQVAEPASTWPPGITPCPSLARARRKATGSPRHPRAASR